jgi:hypothetical protein
MLLAHNSPCFQAHGRLCVLLQLQASGLAVPAGLQPMVDQQAERSSATSSQSSKAATTCMQMHQLSRYAWER